MIGCLFYSPPLVKFCVDNSKIQNNFHFKISFEVEEEKLIIFWVCLFVCRRYAEYSSFKLYSEREQYKLEIGGYTGNAGDSLNDPWYGSNLSPFSTYNR